VPVPRRLGCQQCLHPQYGGFRQVSPGLTVLTWWAWTTAQTRKHFPQMASNGMAAWRRQALASADKTGLLSLMEAACAPIARLCQNANVQGTEDAVDSPVS
jgi:hypothetical protein